VIDIGMPRLNGYDAVRRIREAEKGRRMVAVALTLEAGAPCDEG
jgi:CheY-like chemotaxis protein